MSNPTQIPWVDGLTIPQALDRTIQRFGQRDAVVFPRLGLRWNYQQFGQQVEQAARGLLALGIRRGEHVAIWSTNVPEWIVLQFATARIGAVLVTINPAYRAFELEYVLKQSDAVALVLTDRFKSSDYFAMLVEVCPEVGAQTPLPSGETAGEVRSIQSQQFPKLRHVIAIKGAAPPGAMSWQQMLALGDKVPLDDVRTASAALKPTDPINIQYTSGTTGFPKAAMLSHRNLLLNVFYSGACQQLSEIDRICIPVPFYHCFGCVLGTLMAAVYGAAMVVPAESFDPTATLDAIEQERCTSLYGVPTMFIAQLHDPSLAKRDLKSLRTGIMAGSPCPIETMRAVVNTMGCREITIGYGQTEASPIITQTRTDDPIELRVETVGRPLPDVEVKIASPGDGHALPDNQQGELCARGHVVMLGYYNNPEATRDAIDPRRLAAHRRSGRPPALRLLQNHRPHQRHGHPRRREHLPARNRGIPVHALRRRTSRRGRHPRPQIRRRTLRLDQAQARRRRHRRRNPRILPQQTSPLQSAALREIRHRIPPNRHRQNPEIQNPRTNARRAGTQRTRNCVNSTAPLRGSIFNCAEHRFGSVCPESQATTMGCEVNMDRFLDHLKKCAEMQFPIDVDSIAADYLTFLSTRVPKDIENQINDDGQPDIGATHNEIKASDIVRPLATKTFPADNLSDSASLLGYIVIGYAISLNQYSSNDDPHKLVYVASLYLYCFIKSGGSPEASGYLSAIQIMATVPLRLDVPAQIQVCRFLTALIPALPVNAFVEPAPMSALAITTSIIAGTILEDLIGFAQQAAALEELDIEWHKVEIDNASPWRKEIACLKGLLADLFSESGRIPDAAKRFIREIRPN